MAYSTEDATAPARVLAQFAKTADKLEIDRKSTRLNSSHTQKSRMPSSA